MEYDRNSEERVWRRVRGEETAPAQPDLGLPGLIAGEMQAGAGYQALAGRFSGREAELLRQMAREERSHEAALRGMHFLVTGEHPAVKIGPQTREPLETALRRCYAGEMRSIAAYESRSHDREYSHVFASMAAQEREHSRQVLALLSTLDPSRHGGKG